ncbi:MAG: hypothetical protein JXR53_03625 [Bacteroidales bacterium]|nr:hypothetical protein [Bacteroidales bacterium]
MNFIRLYKTGSLSKAGVNLSLPNNEFLDFQSTHIGIIPQGSENDLQQFIKNSAFGRSDRMVHLAAFVAKNMIGSLKIDGPVIVNIGSSRGATESWEKFHGEFAKSGKLGPACSPLTTQAHVSSVIASMLETENGFAIDHSLTCSTGTAALINAIAWLKSGMCKYALVGGSEASNTKFTLAQIEALGIASKFDGPYYCRPFNTDKKNSFVLAEGAGLAFLELCDEKKLQTGDIIIESTGFAQTAPPSLTGIDPAGMPLQKAMKMALENIGTKPDLILAHAPGTVKGDQAEFNAIQSVFAENLPAIYSSKWITGHTYAASGMLNLSLAEKIFNGFIPTDYPYETYAPYLHPEKINSIMINSTGFGGNAVSVLLRKISNSNY